MTFESIIQVTDPKTKAVLDIPAELVDEYLKDYIRGFSNGMRAGFTQGIAVTAISAAIAAGVAYGTFKFWVWQEKINAKTEEK